MWAFSERLYPKSNHHFAQMYQVLLYLLMGRTRQKRGGADARLCPTSLRSGGRPGERAFSDTVAVH
jgi:hypothetical protein